MSGIACIFHTDGRPASRQALAAMTAAMDYRGPDGIDHYVNGAIALGQCTMHTTAESRDAPLPLANAQGTRVVVIDGYLANYDDLRAELLQHGVALRNRSDAELVLCAYEKWGKDCPRHIDGEFAFIIWDGHANSVFCAQDHQGLRSLLYHWDGSTFVAATDVAGVLAGLDYQPEIDRKYLAELIAHNPISRHRTVWEGITRVQQAQWVNIGPQGLKSAEYWTLSTEVTIRYRRMEDYVEHYRHMLTECVRRAARTDSKLALEVSGGLDSSSIFAIANLLAQQGRLPAPASQGYTYLTPEGDPAYEMDYARAVSAHVGQPLTEVPLFLPDGAWYEATGAADRDLAPFPNMAMSIGLQRRMAADGCRVTLNGQGGDQWLDGKSYSYNELLRSFDLPELIAQARADAAAFGWKPTLRLAADFGLRPMVPASVRRLLRRNDGEGTRIHSDGPQPLNNEFVAYLEEAVASRADEYAARWHSDYKLLKWRAPLLQRIVESFARQHARAGVESRSPMFSRAFIEFSAATPEHTRYRGGIRKLIHRQAMADLLPPYVLARTTKAGFSISYYHLMDMLTVFFRDRVASDSRGLFDPVGTQQLFEHFCNAAIDERVYWDIWGIYVATTIIDQVAAAKFEEL